MTATIRDLIMSFLHRYFFILKAASDGWRVIYIGGNQYRFHKPNAQAKSSLDFIRKYKMRLVEM